MRSPSWIRLTLSGWLAAASGQDIVSSPLEASMLVNGPRTVSSVSGTSLPAETTISRTTITHTLGPGSTGVPAGFELNLENTEKVNLEWRRGLENELAGGDSFLFEIRGDTPSRPNVHDPDEGHPLKVPREWIFCHAKGYDPNVFDHTNDLVQCLWDFANGLDQGEFECYGRMMYFTLENWANRTEGVRGCSPCWNHCSGHGRAWCDCTNQSDIRVPKVWAGWQPIKHTFTKGWQNTISAASSFIGMSGHYDKRSKATTAAEKAEASDSSSPDASSGAGGSPTLASSETSAPSSATTSKTQQSDKPLSASTTTTTGSSTSTRKTSHLSHITPAPKKWKRGGSPEWHTYTPADNHTAAAEYKSKLMSRGLMDHEGNWKGPIPHNARSRHGKNRHNGTHRSGDGNNATAIAHDHEKRLIPPWHWIDTPPPGLTCFSQGYSPDVNDSLYYWFENTARAGREGTFEMDVPWNVNASIELTEWDSTIDCWNACKDCAAWGLYNSRNLMWCDYHIGWIVNCHVGWEPIDAWMLARTDMWGEYITGMFWTLTDHWYTTPRSWIMASKQHITPWLPLRPQASSTHFFANASSAAATVPGAVAAVATEATEGAIKYWDVYCTAAYAGFELDDWEITHTRTDWGWTGWYTHAATTENVFTTDPAAPKTTSTTLSVSSASWGPGNYSVVYPTACPTTGSQAAAVARKRHPRARALRLDVHSDAAAVAAAGTTCADCQESCNMCIDWGFRERRANVSCVVKAQRADGPGLCEADFVLALEATGSMTLPSTSSAFVPTWPAGWTGAKVAGDRTYLPRTTTVTRGAAAVATTQWWASVDGGSSVLLSEAPASEPSEPSTSSESESSMSASSVSVG